MPAGAPVGGSRAPVPDKSLMLYQECEAEREGGSEGASEWGGGVIKKQKVTCTIGLISHTLSSPWSCWQRLFVLFTKHRNGKLSPNVFLIPLKRIRKT